MKLEDVKIGQIVVDKFGNEYEITYVDYNNKVTPVEMVCIKFIEKSYVGSVFHFDKVGTKLCIIIDDKWYCSEIFKPDVTVESLKLKTDNEEIDLKSLLNEIEELKKRVAYLEKLNCSEYH